MKKKLYGIEYTADDGVRKIHKVIGLRLLCINKSDAEEWVADITKNKSLKDPKVVVVVKK